MGCRASNAAALAVVTLATALAAGSERSTAGDAAAAAAQGAARLPGLELVLKPHATGAADSYLAVRMTLIDPAVPMGKTLVRMPLKIVGIPTARYDGNAIVASDAQGPLPLTTHEEPPTPQAVYRDWQVARATVGDVVLTYRAPPRVVTAATNNGPLFDLREEAGGFAGAGIGFLALPTKEGPWHVRLKWDLADAPPGSRGEWSLGDGDVEVDTPAETLGFSYYAAGPLKSIPAKSDGRFGLYWLVNPPFDAALLGGRITALYSTMSRFFQDADSSYRVFMRQNPYPGMGGSALAGSFMFGYNAAENPTVDRLQGLLAHEMTHNWPALEGEHGDTAWYSEGTADYYSALLSQRGGELSTEKFLADINEKASAYYTNPYIHLSNREAAKLFWTDPIAQTVPYGRGFLYLVITDAAIRDHSRGRRSLDDVVLELYRRKTHHQPYGIPQWLDLVGKEIGSRAARRAYDAMVSGTLQVPPARRFAPCFRVAARPTRAFELGFARASLSEDRIVRGLDPNSAAARAGIRNGDSIVDVTNLLQARKNDSQTITLALHRDGADVAVAYLPRGEVVAGYAWVRDHAVPESSCRF